MSDRSRDRDVGVLALLASAIRAHWIEAALVVLAAGALAVGLTAFNDSSRPYDVLRDVFGGEPSTDVDHVFLSALLEMHEGEWRVRPGQAQSVPVRGISNFAVRHESAGARLVPGAPVVRAVGAAHRQRRAADWSIASRYRIAPEGPGPALATWEAVVDVGGERTHSYPVVVDAGNVAIGSEAWHYAGITPERGTLLHLIVLAPRGCGDPNDVETWRSLVRTAALARAADDAPDDNEQLVPMQEPHLIRVAMLLGVDDALAALDERPFRAHDGVSVDATKIARFVERLANPAQVLAWLRETYRDDPELVAAFQGLLDRYYISGDRMTADPPRPPSYPFLVPLAALSLIAVFPAGRFTALRSRDVVALLGALLLASVDVAIIEHVTVETFGLMAVALQLARLRRRGALVLPAGVPRAFAVAALLLPLASMTRLPTVDALGRALAFVGIASLALAALVPAAPRSDLPRAAGAGRSVAWTSLQMVAMVLSVVAFAVVLLEPWEWSRRPPHPRWTLLSIGIAFAGVAGVEAYLRRRPTRPPPIAAADVTIAAAVHLAVIAISPLPLPRLPGEDTLAYVTVVTTVILVAFATGRLLSVARRAAV